MFFEFHKASDLSLQDAVRPPKPDILLKKDHSPPPRAVIFSVCQRTQHKIKQEQHKLRNS